MNINVEGYNNLKRDITTGAILNTDSSEYEKYLNLKKIKNTEKDKINTIIEDISVLKSELSELKTLLTNLVKQNGRI